jgi:hypothetical protein
MLGLLRDMSEGLQAAVADPTVALIYTPGDRTYNVLYLDPGKSVPRTVRTRDPRQRSFLWSNYYWEFEVDPWSGRSLPQSIGLAYQAVAKAEFGVDVSVYDPKKPNNLMTLPDHLLFEEWWPNYPNVAYSIGWPQPKPLSEWFRPKPKQDPEDLAELGEEVDFWDEEFGQLYLPYHNPARPGISRFQGRPPHMCRDIRITLFGPRRMFWYVPEDREYGFRILDLSKPADHQPIKVFAAHYCPWCGTRLPESLKAERRRRLKALGIDPDADTKKSRRTPSKIPPEFRDETWWRDAGL